MNQQYGTNPYAQEALGLASAARGQEGMLSTSAPVGPERMNSTGMADKVEVNEQPEKNIQYTLQGQKQNIISAVPQAQSNALRGLGKNQTDQSQAEYEAQEMLNQRMTEVLYANDGGSALMRIAEETSDPSSARNFMQRVGEGKLMAEGNNPQAGNFRSTATYS